jgi:hypothetical protein
VPVSSFHLKLPAGPFSALAARGDLCHKPLLMPTTITAQNGAVIKQKTRIAVSGCKKHRHRHRHRRRHPHHRHSHRHARTHARARGRRH